MTWHCMTDYVIHSLLFSPTFHKRAIFYDTLQRRKKSNGFLKSEKVKINCFIHRSLTDRISLSAFLYKPKL